MKTIYQGTGSRDLLMSAQSRVAAGFSSEVQVRWDAHWPMANPKDKVICLPPVPDELDDDVVDLYRAFVDHEAAHLLFTDPDVLVDARMADAGGQVRHLFNAIEDGRINKEMAKRFPGSRANINRGHELLRKREGPEEGYGTPIQQAFALASMALVRMAEGRPLHEALRLVGAEASSSTLYLLSMIRDITEELPDLRSSDDAKRCAIKIHERWASLAREQPDDPASPSSSGDTTPPDAELDEDDELQEERWDRSRLPPPDFPVRGYLGPHPDLQLEQERTGVSEILPSPRVLSSLGYRRARTSCGHESLGIGEELARRLHVLLEQRHRTPSLPPAHGRYVARTTHDREEAIATDYHESTRSLHAAARRKVAFVTARLMADLQCPGSRWSSHRTSGRLDSRRLHRVGVDDRRVFRTRVRVSRIDAAISLLVDFSGSMKGDRIVTATQLAMVFSEACDALDVPNEVLGFTTQGWETNPPDESYASYVRWVPQRLLIIKPWSRGFPQSIHAFARALHEVELCHNADGEAIRWAARRLATETARRRILLVLSDGRPEGASEYPGHDVILEQDLRDAVKEVSALGVRCLGLGIESESVEDFYPDSVVFHQVDDLVRGAYEVISRILTGRGPRP